MKMLGKLISLLTLACYGLILLVLIVAAPIIAGLKPVVVLSGSMEPDYPKGSVIYYKKASFDGISVGDVISYVIKDDASSLVTHRVEAKDKTQRTFTTKGDANKTADATTVPYTSVKGKVVSYQLPYIGYLIQAVQNYYVVVLVFLILTLKMFFNRFDEQEQKERDNEMAEAANERQE